MATQAQIDANRINAQKSTGPRTPQGKAKSRRNALKLGLSASALMISGEDSREMAEIGQDYIRMFTPANAFQRFHIENVIYCEWMIRRCRRIEAELLNHLMMKDRSIPWEVAAGCAYERDTAGSNALYKLHRRMNQLEKSYYRSLGELEACGARFDRVPKAGPASESDPNGGLEYDPESEKFYYSAPSPASEAHAAPEPESPAGHEAAAAEPETVAPPAPSPEIGFVLSNSANAPEPGGKTSQSPRHPSARNPTRTRGGSGQMRSAR